MQLLVIKISDLEKNPEYALLGKKQAQDRYSLGNWKKIRSLSRGRKVVVLLSSDEIVLTSVSIPSKNQKQLLQAIPYALEDTLAEDIEELHFSAQQNAKSENNETLVAIINRSVLIRVLDLLKSHRITPHFVLPELLSQKYETDAWSIIYTNIDGQISANVRLDQFNGFKCDQQMLDMFISDHLEKKSPSSIFSNTKVENLPASLQDLNTNFIESDTVEYSSVVSALAINLLTNFTQRNQQKSSINFKAWKPVTILGSVLVGTWIGISFWQNNLLQQQSNQLKKQIEQVYKSAFPKGRIVDAPVQMNTALSKLRSNTGQIQESPLPLIASIGPLLKEYKDFALSEMRFQENQLSMTIESPNLTRLENFKRDAAEKRNLNVEIKDSTTTSNKVKAVIVITLLPNNTVKKPDLTMNKLENS